MAQQEQVAVIGAGVIGCALAWELTRAGHAVTLLDPAAPGVGGASFGNVGHIAAELVEPLPSPGLLFSFPRLLFAFGGPLDMPWRRLPRIALWARRFALAAWRRRGNTRQLAPLVRPAGAAWERLLSDVGAVQLLRRNGHYQVWFGARAGQRAAAEAQHMRRLGIPTRPVAAELLASVVHAAGGSGGAGLEFPESGHVLDPRLVCETLARAASARGATLRRLRVESIAARGAGLELRGAGATVSATTAIVCAGPWAAALLTPFGLTVPLESVRGYHVELPGEAPLIDAPLIYMDDNLLVTPMAGRLRASSYMEFAAPEAPPDARKPARLCRQLQRLGYRTAGVRGSWVGARPVLPDYLPGIGRVPGVAGLYYAVGHQHLGLTLAPVTAQLLAAAIAGREPAHDLAPFDLRRFG